MNGIARRARILMTFSTRYDSGPPSLRVLLRTKIPPLRPPRVVQVRVSPSILPSTRYPSPSLSDIDASLTICF
jgi:hypothetical protein